MMTSRLILLGVLLAAAAVLSVLLLLCEDTHIALKMALARCALSRSLGCLYVFATRTSTLFVVVEIKLESLSQEPTQTCNTSEQNKCMQQGRMYCTVVLYPGRYCRHSSMYLYVYISVRDDELFVLKIILCTKHLVHKYLITQ